MVCYKTVLIVVAKAVCWRLCNKIRAFFDISCNRIRAIYSNRVKEKGQLVQAVHRAEFKFPLPMSSLDPNYLLEV